MRIFFVLKQTNYARVFAGVIRTLASRGHHVRVAFQETGKEPPEELNVPGVTLRSIHSKREDAWRRHVPVIRRAADYLRYLEPAYSRAWKLRARAFDKLLHSLSGGKRTSGGAAANTLMALTGDERQQLMDLFASIEDVIPPDPGTMEALREEEPDVLLISPLVDLGSGQSDFVKAAKALGIPTGLLLFSWDNLSTKGTLHVMPDRLFVWNDLIRREAMTLHGVPAERIVVTGAPKFDPFFELSPVLTRRELLAPLGLDPEQPLITYLCSSKFVSGDELTFLGEWLAAVRRSDGSLRNVNLLIRPHPDVKPTEREGAVEKVRWRDASLGRGWLTRPFDDARTVLLRTPGGQPFFECLHHASAVVGLNTTAEIEAAIAGKPVFTIIAPADVIDGQDSTLHFHYLLHANGGFVHHARDLDEHVSQLEASLKRPPDSGGIQRFVQEFVRPAGMDRQVRLVLADEIERLQELGGDHAPPHAPEGATAPRGGHPPEPLSGISRADGANEILRLDYPAADLKLRVSSEFERVHRVRACAKEPWTVTWIESTIRKGEVLYDIGANVGAFSLIAAARGGRVLAFEPGYANYARLCENIALNESGSSVAPLPLALSDTSTLTPFAYSSVDPGQSRHAMADDPWTPWTRSKKGRHAQPICAIRLDDAVAMFNLPEPDHLKIDVDGAELRVIRGAPRVLRGPHLRSALVEVDGPFWDEVVGEMELHGFRLTDRFQRTAKSPAYALFLRS